jgi:Zinc finger C-x8-C-x5-C-x3-H type (and similar)/RNA-binding, Nab2-type zinc finger
MAGPPSLANDRHRRGSVSSVASSNMTGATSGLMNPRSKRSQSFSHTVKLQFHKTQMCQFFLENDCKLAADECSYAHDRSELKSAPDLTKTRMCPLLENCPKQNLCPYAHTHDELKHTDQFFKSRLCKFFEKTGKCTLGDNCRFAHGEHQLHKPVTVIDDQVEEQATPIDTPNNEEESIIQPIAPIIETSASVPPTLQNGRRWSVCSGAISLDTMKLFSAEYLRNLSKSQKYED